MAIPRMKNSPWLFLILLIMAFTAGAFAQVNQKLLQGSDIVVLGSVVDRRPAGWVDVPDSPEMQYVKVEEVYEKPPSVVLRAGDIVAILRGTAAKVPLGKRAIFYTTGWIFGQHIAMKEVGHEFPSLGVLPGAIQAKAQVANARSAIADADLNARVEKADLVIAGQVVNLRPGRLVQASGRPVLPREHDPDWQEAIVHVQTWIKGEQRGSEVVVRFPASQDVAWAAIPKLRIGQENTFILQHDAVSGLGNSFLAGELVATYSITSTKDVADRNLRISARPRAKRP